MYKEFIEKLGVSAETLELLGKETEDENKPNLDELAASELNRQADLVVRSDKVQALLNEQKESVQKDAYSSVFGPIEGAAKKLGIDTSEWKEQRPSPKELANILFNAGQSATGKDLTEIQRENIELKNQIEGFGEKVNGAVTERDSYWKSQIATDKRTEHAIKLVAQEKSKQGSDLANLDVGVIANIALAGISNKGIEVGYDFENKTFKAKTKDGGVPTNEKGNQELDFDGLILRELEPIRIKNGGTPEATPNGNGTVNPSAQSNGEFVQPETLKLREKLMKTGAIPAE